VSSPTSGRRLPGRIVAVAVGLLAASCVARSTWEAPPKRIAFTGVHVVSMVEGAPPVLADRAVLVTDGVVEVIAPANGFVPPEDAVVIAPDEETWLVPGLSDMHVHLLSNDRIDPALVESELDVLLANGVTSARVPAGNARLLQLRAEIESGFVVAPHLDVASPQLVGESPGPGFHGIVVDTPEAGARAVHELAEAGYDAIKLTYWIRPDVYDAIVAAAREVELPVIGHVGPEIGLQRALDAGQQIEHLDPFLAALLPEDAGVEGGPFGLAIWDPDRWETLEHLEEARIPALASQAAAAGLWCSPTLRFANESFGTGRPNAAIDATPDARFVSESVREALLAGRDLFWSDPPTAEQRARFVHLRDALTLELQRAGVRLMAGSESPEWMLLPGFTLHRELESLVAAGLSPWEALATATRNPAEWRGDLDRVGTIEVGKRADLVLLGADPLEAIENTRAVEGVLIHGRWLGKRRLERLLDHAARKLSRAELVEGS